MTPDGRALHSGTVNGVGTLICPVLVGRDDLLALAERRLEQAATGRGHVLFLAGEAGIGKTRLLGSVMREAALRGFVVVTGDVGPRDVEVPAAPLLDLTRSMARHASLRPVSDVIRDRLLSDGGSTEAAAPDNKARARRLLVTDIADALAGLPSRGPVLIAMENLHWADDLSLEVLAAVAARAPELPVLVVGTYRSDELFPRVPMREWRTRLVTQRLAEEARLQRLTADEIGTMTTLLLEAALPASRAVVEALHRRTDGIPLYVEELLGVLRSAPGTIDDAIARPEVPDTIEFAVRERLERRTPRARALAEAASVVGRSFVVDMIAGMTDTPTEQLSGPLQELIDQYVVVETDRPGLYDFRHVLIRDAIYGLVPEPVRRRLHGRVAELRDLLPETGDAFTSAHFELAGRRLQAYQAAVRGACQAAAISAHREAAELYRRALRTMPEEVDELTRGTVLEAAAVEAAALDDNEIAADLFARARTHYRRADRPIEAAGVVAPLVAVRHLLGDNLDARTRPLHAALAELEGLGSDPGVESARLRVLAELSAAYMLDRRLEASMKHGRAAETLARRLGDPARELHARITVGSDLVFSGRMDEGWERLETSIRDARAQGLDEETARAYRMAGSCASVLAEYGRADGYLTAGIQFAEQAELWNHRHYMASHLAHVRWATGRWDEAESGALHALADGRGGITTRITALLVLGYVALGRGEAASARGRLDEALALGESMRELQRRSPAIWGLAELELLTGNSADAVGLSETGRSLSMAVDDAAYLFPFLVTGTRARLAVGDVASAESWVGQVSTVLARRRIPGTLPALDHAQGLLHQAHGSLARAQRSLDAAAAGWTAVGRVPDAIAATIDAAGCSLRAGRLVAALSTSQEAIDAATAVGARPLADRARVVLDAARARHPDAAPWAPLTSREFEVARLVADGYTNAAVAEELGIAPRTVGAHVEHIMAKLGVGRRAEIAVWAAARTTRATPPGG